MLSNALIKPILDYCRTVWGNCSVENLLRLLQVQKRCARLILDATINDSSVELFDKLGWLPIDDIVPLENSLCYTKLARVIVPNLSPHILNMLGLHMVIEPDDM